MIESPPEDWQDVRDELEALIASGRLRGVAYVYHKVPEEVTEDSIYRTATKGYPECLTLLRRNMELADALKDCGIPVSTTRN